MCGSDRECERFSVSVQDAPCLSPWLPGMACRTNPELGTQKKIIDEELKPRGGGGVEEKLGFFRQKPASEQKRGPESFCFIF